MSNFGRNLALWVIIALLLVVLFNLFQPGATHPAATQVAYSDFISEVNGGRVRDVVIQGRTVSGQLTDGRTFQTYTPEDPSLVQRLTDKGVRVIAKPEDSDVNPLLHYLLSWFPMLLLIGVWVFFMRQMQSGGGRAMGFGKSRARMLTEKQGRVTFEDVAGIDEAKGELQEIVEFLKDPQKFQRLGGRSRRVCCWWDRPARVRLCWREPLRARLTCHSSRFPARTSLRCSSASAPAVSATCSSRARRTRLALSSSTKSTPSVATVAPVWAAATTSASRL